MTGEEFRLAREAAGLTRRQWAAALGFRLAKPLQHITAMETGRRTITVPVARLARMYAKHGAPESWCGPRLTEAA